MNHRKISLKAKVRYEGLVHTTDRRNQGTDLEELPDPIWRTVGQVLRKNFRRIISGRKRARTIRAKKLSLAAPR